MDTDRKVSAKELQRWIMAKTAEHFQEAVQESRAHFRAVDPDGDGAAPAPAPARLTGAGGVGAGRALAGAAGRTRPPGPAALAATSVLLPPGGPFPAALKQQSACLYSCHTP